MKKASETMFRIGNIFTILYLALGALLLLIGIIAAIVGGIGVAADANDPAAIAALSSGGACIGWGIYFLVTSIVCLILVKKAQRELADESTQNRKPFIVSIVCGAIASNVFYVLAGIFGLIAEGQQGQAKAE